MASDFWTDASRLSSKGTVYKSLSILFLSPTATVRIFSISICHKNFESNPFFWDFGSEPTLAPKTQIHYGRPARIACIMGQRTNNSDIQEDFSAFRQIRSDKTKTNRERAFFYRRPSLWHLYHFPDRIKKKEMGTPLLSFSWSQATRDNACCHTTRNMAPHYYPRSPHLRKRRLFSNSIKYHCGRDRF